MQLKYTMRFMIVLITLYLGGCGGEDDNLRAEQLTGLDGFWTSECYYDRVQDAYVVDEILFSGTRFSGSAYIYLNARDCNGPTPRVVDYSGSFFATEDVVLGTGLLAREFEFNLDDNFGSNRPSLAYYQISNGRLTEYFDTSGSEFLVYN